MKRRGLKGKREKKMSAFHGVACARVEPQKRRTVCGGNCGRCQTCKDDFFEQICHEVEGTYPDKAVQ